MKSPSFLRWPLILLAIGGCKSDADSVDTSRPSEFGFQASLKTSLIEEGRVAYAEYCMGCHGANGEGNGEAAPFFQPRPRNFVLADFKFSRTRSGQLPTDEDLARTIKRGLKGSAMPPFDLLPDRTVNALVAYIKTFSPKWAERDPAEPIPVVEDPYRSNPDKTEAIARGEKIYHAYATCWVCHPAYVPPEKINEYRAAIGSPKIETFRDKLNEAVGKANTEGDIIFPPDFLRDFVRSGAGVEDLYRSVSAGITGTAMPTWVDSMHVAGKSPGDPPLVQQSDLWAMAYYIQDLIAHRPPKLQEGKFTIRDRKRPIYLHGAPPPQPTTQPEKEETLDVEF